MEGATCSEISEESMAEWNGKLAAGAAKRDVLLLFCFCGGVWGRAELGRERDRRIGECQAFHHIEKKKWLRFFGTHDLSFSTFFASIIGA